MTPEEIDELEWSDISGLFDYWKEEPPTHQLVQGLMISFGVMKPKEEEQTNSKELSEDDFNQLAQLLGST